MSLLCSLLFGLVPAWQATNSDVIGMLKQDPASARRSGVTRGLLVCGAARAVAVLLVGAGLMGAHSSACASVPLGFDPVARDDDAGVGCRDSDSTAGISRKGR